MQVHFIHCGNAYLPELTAYAQYLQHLGHRARVHPHWGDVPLDAQVLWWMCGRVPQEAPRRWPQAFQIHEYASASVAPWPWLKDQIKRATQPCPQYRIFQNDWVRSRLGRNDGVPYELRDMGIAPSFFEATAGAGLVQKVPEADDFDAVYLGDMQRLRYFVPLLHALQALGQRVLLIGEVAPALRQILSPTPFLTITGRIPQHDVPAWLRRARWGLNLVPPHAPYHRQTSTKLLEYCAVGLPVVSTDYPWVRDFAHTYSAQFAYLPAPLTRDTAARAAYAAWWVQLQQSQQLDRTAYASPSLRNKAWPLLLQGLAVWRAVGLQS